MTISAKTTPKRQQQRALGYGRELEQAFDEVRDRFPFPETYLRGKFFKFELVASLLQDHVPRDATVLSLGAGACDVEAGLSVLGYQVTGIDDYNEPWHLMGDNRERIIEFAADMGVTAIRRDAVMATVEDDSFDAVLILDVIEHMHNSPRELLNYAASKAKEGGVVIVLTPNAAHLANRLKLLTGKTNHTSLEGYYWSTYSFRGHVREYTEAELREVLADYHGLEIVDTRLLNNMVYWAELDGPLQNLVRAAYIRVCEAYPRFRDTMVMVGRKPSGWTATPPKVSEYKKYYTYIEKCNLDGLSDEELLEAYRTAYQTGE
ncbi:bifunctional 2-polyprenyl-6-hydroxyphenol methylase/3-demethylubiquinol 3-O-methyltransferase UbiG [Haladaptatus sp. DYSN1]|uniref:class I SAM-dependent methyltransferase n=1 Tax=unclassified Haladaptatus TaxID=2622732 RepID=UPI002406E339|nr:class I SAM-dependent methyltransferase [Haladaptatus sp. DYSN1]